ncbi:TetR/AcrR family transcriptional regulator [Tessaracoccus lubricantis]|uniref:TetR/AcrR family transcriptional regulator n=1 Tax=Tessaracoccus lubricantis TaxID=545543 RepID=A0ABP9EXZ9_9ACTN
MTVIDAARRRATRGRLVEAAVREFGRNGIDATSVEQLCEAAGFTRGAFYSNFSSKDELCIEIARHVFEEMAARLQEVLASMPESFRPDEIIPALLDVTQLSTDLHATQVELELRAARHPEFGEQLEVARRDLWPLYVEFAEKAAARGRVRFTIPVHDALQVLAALHHSPAYIGRTGESRRLIMLMTEHFIAPTTEAEA